MGTEKITFIESETVGTAKAQSATSPAKPMDVSSQWKAFFLAMGVLVVCFSMPFLRLARFAWGNELYSYILLVPFISWYLARMKKNKSPAVSRPWRGAGIFCALAGIGVLAYYFLVLRSEGGFEMEDGLALLMLSFFFIFAGAVLAFLGRETVHSLAFPLGMMFFIVPMPAFVREGIENFLQYGSAYVTHGMFKMSGLPFVRDGLVFILPGMPQGIEIARECSGIHSTLILFITSLLAGYLFLRSPWKRAMLAALVVPLGLLRNGFRVFTIGQLCVHYGPQMIDSPIHRKGGPLFFVLSLIPFFALLAWMYKTEHRKENPGQKLTET